MTPSHSLACALLLVAPTLAQVPSVGAARRLHVPADYPTVQSAIDAAESGDAVLIAPGTYFENVVLNDKAIVLASEFLTTGDGGFVPLTVLDGGGGAVVYVGPTVPSGTRIVGLTITGGSDGLFVESDVSIEDCMIVDNGDGIDYESAGGTCVRCLIADNGDDGVDLDGACAVRLRDNAILDNGDDGVEIRLHAYAGPLLEIVLRRNLIAGNGEDGIQIIDYPDVSDRVLRIERNLVRDSVLAGVGMMGGGDTVEDLHGEPIPERVYLVGNTFLDNGWGVTGGANLIALDNLFVGTTSTAVHAAAGGSIVAYSMFWDNGTDHTSSTVDAGTLWTLDPLLAPDGTLSAGSPAVDLGAAQYWWNGELVLDLGPARYLGAAPDLGAFERE